MIVCLYQSITTSRHFRCALFPLPLAHLSISFYTKSSLSLFICVYLYIYLYFAKILSLSRDCLTRFVSQDLIMFAIELLTQRIIPLSDIWERKQLINLIINYFIYATDGLIDSFSIIDSYIYQINTNDNVTREGGVNWVGIEIFDTKKKKWSSQNCYTSTQD